jgi:DNA polymerase-1
MLYRTADAFRDLNAKVGEQVIGTGGMYGFLNVAVRVFRRYGGMTHVAWEGKRSRNFRRELYPDYKKRTEPDPELAAFLEDMQKQEVRLKAILRAMGVSQWEGTNCEADDVIGHLACVRYPRARVVIYTGDSDLRQLVDDRVTVVSPGFRGVDSMYDAARVAEKHGVAPELLPDLKALAGDSSDGIPGLRGIGAKTAAKLVATLGDIEAVISAASAEAGEWPAPVRFKPLVAEQADTVRLFKKLTTVRTHEAGVREIARKRDKAMVIKHFMAYQFRTLVIQNELYDLMRMGGSGDE